MVELEVRKWAYFRKFWANSAYFHTPKLTTRGPNFFDGLKASQNKYIDQLEVNTGTYSENRFSD